MELNRYSVINEKNKREIMKGGCKKWLKIIERLM